MSVQLECDRCGFQEQTSGVMLFAGLTGPGIPTARPELPHDWTRPRLPTEDGELRDRELCPGCKEALLRFMDGAAIDKADECTDCGHVHPGRRCMSPAPGGYCCGCTAGAVKIGASPDNG